MLIYRLFPVIQEELGISASLTQMSLTMCLIGLALGPLAIGTLSDRIGRKKTSCYRDNRSDSLLFTCSLRAKYLVIPSFASLARNLQFRRDRFDPCDCERFIYRRTADEVFAMLIAVNGIFPDHFPTARRCDFGSGFLANDFFFLGGFRHPAIAWYSLWLSGNITDARTHPSDGIWLAGSIV